MENLGEAVDYAVNVCGIDINKASVSSVVAMARVLDCDVEELLNKGIAEEEC